MAEVAEMVEGTQEAQIVDVVPERIIRASSAGVDLPEDEPRRLALEVGRELFILKSRGCRVVEVMFTARLEEVRA
jgi:hypothetical protein